MEKNKKKNKASGIIIVAVGFLIGCLGGFLVVSLINRMFDNNGKGASFGEFLGSLAAFLVFYIFGIIIHEAGHLIMGLATGYKFVSFRVGSTTLVKENGRLVRRKFNIAGTGGQCIMTHEPAEDPENQPYFWYHFGGGLINFLCAFIGAAGYLMLGNKYAQVLFAIFGLVSLMLAFMNLFPLNIGVPNDGYNIYLLHKSALNRKLMFNSLVINGLQFEGKKLRDMPDNFFEGADPGGGIIETGIAFCSAARELDRKNFSAAKEIYTQLLDNEKLIGLYENECKCELMFCKIVTGCDKAEIEEIYDKSLKQYILTTGKTYIMRKRLMYAYYLIIKKDKEKAEYEYEQAVKLIDTYPCRGEYESEMEIIEYIKKNYTI